MELRTRAVDPQISPSQHGGILFDVVGTGADMAHTFNISSCTMFIVASAGVAVAKHGNRAITSQCGSADVLSALGARIELPGSWPAIACRRRESHSFLRRFIHPAFQVIAPVRRKLAERRQRTIFNILGPLLNPAARPIN